MGMKACCSRRVAPLSLPQLNNEMTCHHSRFLREWCGRRCVPVEHPISVSPHSETPPRSDPSFHLATPPPLVEEPRVVARIR